MLKSDRRLYRNYSGCGNTLNCNHPVVRSYILDCLRYWVIEMHVDGFRFDLASVLGRDETGNVLSNPPPSRPSLRSHFARCKAHRGGLGCRRRLPGGVVPRAALV